ncbi:MAG: hypothetical protein MJZ26_01205 [Fibrobacter sp.]|nr:hypothetical protein [Fibrobacter sp.]
MSRVGLFIFAVALMAISVSAKGICGTAHMVQHHRDAAQQQAKTVLARATTTGCTDEDFYDSVYTKKTEHFQIFYTLSGPHQTTMEFVDTLAKDAEYAWDFHVKKSGMKSPAGVPTTYHYLQKVEDNLYPIEIVDIDLLRDTRNLLGGSCHGCYGLTIPSDIIPEKSSLVIENDFRFTPTHHPTKDTVDFNGKTCDYNMATEDLLNEAHDYSYADKWESALRVTTIHELYHAVQLRYVDMYKYWTFWFEASAAGTEEIAAPEIDDYHSYLKSLSKSVGTPLDRLIEDYGVGILYIYLHNHVNKQTDKFIWESYASHPEESFQFQLNAFGKKNNLSADSLFHDFATRLAFAGQQASAIDSSLWIGDDQPLWPNFKRTHISENSSEFLNSGTDVLEPLSYNFFVDKSPNLENFKGNVSIAIYKNNTATTTHLSTTNAIDSVISSISRDPSVDSTLWILSRFDESEPIHTIVKDSTLRAYPTPWRNGNLCFTPLPKGKKFIEIRNRRGDLVTREKYEGQTLCMEESKVKDLMVPGVYRFRAGSSGKTQNFIVIY